MSSQRKFTFAISSPDEFLVLLDCITKCQTATRKAFMFAARSLCDSWATCQMYLYKTYWYWYFIKIQAANV